MARGLVLPYRALLRFRDRRSLRILTIDSMVHRDEVRAHPPVTPRRIVKLVILSASFGAVADRVDWPP